MGFSVSIASAIVLVGWLALVGSISGTMLTTLNEIGTLVNSTPSDSIKQGVQLGLQITSVQNRSINFSVVNTGSIAIFLRNETFAWNSVIVSYNATSWQTYLIDNYTVLAISVAGTNESFDVSSHQSLNPGEQVFIEVYLPAQAPEIPLGSVVDVVFASNYGVCANQEISLSTYGDQELTSSNGSTNSGSGATAPTYVDSLPNVAVYQNLTLAWVHAADSGSGITNAYFTCMAPNGTYLYTQLAMTLTNGTAVDGIWSAYLPNPISAQGNNYIAYFQIGDAAGNWQTQMVIFSIANALVGTWSINGVNLGSGIMYFNTPQLFFEYVETTGAPYNSITCTVSWTGTVSGSINCTYVSGPPNIFLSPNIALPDGKYTMIFSVTDGVNTVILNVTAELDSGLHTILAI